MAERPRAAFLPDRGVRVAAALLPRSARDRYEREFLSELSGLTTSEQLRYAFDVLIHTSSLRAAIREQPTEAMMTEAHRPLTCRLNLHHHWVTLTNDDGEDFDRCSRCGRDRGDFGPDASDRNAVAGAIGFVSGAGM